jgi:hypothetical protein
MQPVVSARRCFRAIGIEPSGQHAGEKTLVNVPAAGPACETTGHVRVVPEDTANSLLYQNENGEQDCGKAMPSAFERLHPVRLEEGQKQMIHDWIAAGAWR